MKNKINYSISTDEFFKNTLKPLPDYIRKHQVWSDIPVIDKLFPRFGLANFREKVQDLNEKKSVLVAQRLLSYFHHQFINRKAKLDKFFASKKKIGKARKARLDEISATLSTLAESLSTPEKQATFVILEKGKLSLKLPLGIKNKDGKSLYNKGSSLFKVYLKINEALVENKTLAMPNYEQAQEFKNYSAENLANNAMSVVFSSHGQEGLWDLATISMRGIASCQTWGKDYDHCLIGTLADPCVGVIYLTSGAKTDYGDKMICRSVVRLVIGKDRKPYLLMDRMYPNLVEETKKIFIQALKNKSGLDVYYTGDNNIVGKMTDFHLPQTKTLLALKKYHNQSYRSKTERILSYQDCPVVEYVNKDKNINFNRDIGNLLYQYYSANSNRFNTGILKIHESHPGLKAIEETYNKYIMAEATWMPFNRRYNDLSDYRNSLLSLLTNSKTTKTKILTQIETGLAWARNEYARHNGYCHYNCQFCKLKKNKVSAPFDLTQEEKEKYIDYIYSFIKPWVRNEYKTLIKEFYQKLPKNIKVFN